MCTAMAWLRVGMAARKDLVFQRAHGCFEESVVEGLPPPDVSAETGARALSAPDWGPVHAPHAWQVWGMSPPV